ncbi:hypothetical protein PNQ29_03525 [Halobacterium salinarum]|nr:hypothetical protein [Halobacterium salinarum]MDL0118814.1 hypothetical protein [Halobacterium salinarum]
MDNHTSRYRLSLIDGDSQHHQQASQDRVKSAVHDLLTETDSKDLHQAWLTSDVAARFNEAVSYPYTSLKYHTLLVATLLDNYRNGHQFNDLHLLVDDAETIVPHRTIYADDEFALRITGADVGQPSARLGRQPQRSWASTWTQLPAHPLDTDHDNYSMVLDANLRRIQSWSTALQYIEDYTEAFQR